MGVFYIHTPVIRHRACTEKPDIALARPLLQDLIMRDRLHARLAREWRLATASVMGKSYCQDQGVTHNQWLRMPDRPRQDLQSC
jgi:hypothetical protein